MGKLRNYIAYLKTITAEQQVKAALEIVRNNEDVIIRYNQSQLLEGKNYKGEFLREYRNPKYKSFKLRINPKGVTDLKVSGSLYDHMYILAERFPVSIFSSDKKVPKLMEDYGNEIFGVSKENKKPLNTYYFVPDVRKYYRNLLRLQ